MDIYRKKLQRADFLLKNERYTMAFKEYEFLLNNTPDIDKKLRAYIEHNEGVMYARLFLFEKAAGMFKAAYEDGRSRESYLQYLAAMRMNLSNKEYVSFIADSDEAYEASMELEGRMKDAQELYSTSKDNLALRAMALYKAENKRHEYYDQVGEITDEMKLTYRDLVKDKVK
jgi:hypothetical protein